MIDYKLIIILNIFPFLILIIVYKKVYAII